MAVGTLSSVFFSRDRVKKKRSDAGDFWSRKRKYGFDDDNFFTAAKRYKRKRLAGPVQIVEERPEPPLVYEPEKFEILRAADLTEAPPEGPLAAAIYGEIKNKKSATRVTASERKALVAYYRQNGFRPLWVSVQGLGERGRAVLRHFESAAKEGMSPEAYLPPTLALFSEDQVTRLTRICALWHASSLSFRRAPFAMLAMPRVGA